MTLQDVSDGQRGGYGTDMAADNSHHVAREANVFKRLRLSYQSPGQCHVLWT